MREPDEGGPSQVAQSQGGTTEKFKKLTDEAQAVVCGEASPKRQCKIGTGSSSSSTAPATSTVDTSMDDSQANCVGRRDLKKQKPDCESEHMEDSGTQQIHLDRQRCLRRVRIDSGEDEQQTLTDPNFFDSQDEDEEPQRVQTCGCALVNGIVVKVGGNEGRRPTHR